MSRRGETAKASQTNPFSEWELCFSFSLARRGGETEEILAQPPKKLRSGKNLRVIQTRQKLQDLLQFPRKVLEHNKF